MNLEPRWWQGAEVVVEVVEAVVVVDPRVLTSVDNLTALQCEDCCIKGIEDLRTSQTSRLVSVRI